MTKHLSDYLSYDPVTGSIVWKKASGPRTKVGSEAGSINSEGYRQIKFDNKLYQAAHVAWFLSYGSWPKDKLDHKDRDRDNQKLKNLREVTHQQNCMNRKRKPPSSGFRGVTKKNSKWQARITLNGITENLGLFDSPELAHDAYQQRAKSSNMKEYIPDG